MINKIFIENFQSHKKTTLELAPGVNVIVGQSDSGKSAILRALRWLIHNKPGGDDFRTYGAKETVVSLVADSCLISRIKSKSENKYELDCRVDVDHTEKEEFKAFGRSGIPEPIDKLLNFNFINLQQQMDSHFLLSNTPGEVGQILNSVVDLTIIDKALSNINKRNRDTQRAVENNQQNLEEAKEELKKFNYLEAAERDLEALEILEEKFHSTLTQRGAVEQVVSDLKAATRELNYFSHVLEAEKPLQDLETKALKAQELGSTCSALENIIARFTKLEQDLERANQLLSQQKSVDELLKSLDYLQGLGKNESELLHIIRNLETQLSNLDYLNKNTEAFEKEFQELMPDVCPLCGRNCECQ